MMDKSMFEVFKLNCAEQIIPAFIKLSSSTFKHSILEKINEHDPMRINPDISAYAEKLAKYAVSYVIGHKGIVNFDALADEVPGFISFYANDKETAHGFISLLVIDRNYQRLGLGRALIELAKESAFANGMRTLGVNVHKENGIVKEFYRKMGFAITGDLGTEFQLEMSL